MSPRSFLTKSLLAVLILLSGTTAWACSVPVFRYALEHWRSDPYQVVFFHRGALSPEEESLLTRLSRSGKAGEISANVEVVAVDLDEADAEDPKTKDDLALWESQNTDTLPWMVVRYPLSIRISKVVWAGEPTVESIDLLLESPKRREIAERILKGDTAVWVFLESGNEDEDNAAFLRLTTELKKAEQELELPPPDPQDIADGLISVDQASLQVRFSTLRLSRTEAQEARFIDMLLDMEPDLRDPEYAQEPMAFPIFGRGRALSFLIGKGIDRDVIFSDSRFLVGPCSCQVKEQNPGVDMLMAVDWDGSVTPQIPVDDSLPPLPVFSPVSDSSESSSAKKFEPTTQTEVSGAGAELEAAATDEPISNSAGRPVAAAGSEELQSQAGSKVLTTMVMLLAAAVFGIAVLSVFMMRKPGA